MVISAALRSWRAETSFDYLTLREKKKRIVVQPRDSVDFQQ